ncbi:hypothetical protein [Longimicrobium sp.]|uniref:hypothetical protein n=1 Tax=Longimicrobium sp. TaxID=2029185 RepID=UPI002E367FA7|nr:hypothetical protein [Longimicrobium sp.]HEX6037596.1 hypothetical protein [Longimicrobium sp.]
MSVQLSAEVVTMFDQLPAARREQVVEYARWLRANPHASLPWRQSGTSSNGDLVIASCPPARSVGGSPPSELEREVCGLTCEQQELIAEHVVAFAAGLGAPGHVFRRFAGTIPEDVLDQMERFIEEECERIDYEGW